MNVGKVIEQREQQWMELDRLCREMGLRKHRKNSQKISRFLSLYRSACADFALADAYHLPPQTVDYLGKLVGRCHTQLYRRRRFPIGDWIERALFETPKHIMNDMCVHLAFVIWTFLFCAAAYLAYSDQVWPGFAQSLGIQEQLEQAQTSFSDFQNRSWVENLEMASYYIVNNTSIGLFCFAAGVLVVPGLVLLVQNAIVIGAVFGHMLRPDMGVAGENFKEFVTAHGPFEITAIILSAGAGLRLGMSILKTDGKTRFHSMVTTGRRALPIAACAVVLFFLAALIEAFVSPIPRDILPWWFKGLVATVSSILLTVYFVVLPFVERNELEAAMTRGAKQSRA